MIKVKEVRVIDAEGEQLGILDTREAIKKAEEAGARPGRSGADGKAAGLPDHGLREVQIRDGQEGRTNPENTRPSSLSKKSS